MQAKIKVEIRSRSGMPLAVDKHASMEHVGQHIIISAAFGHMDPADGQAVLIMRAEKDFGDFWKAENFYLEIVRHGGITKRMLRALSFKYEEAMV